jgi:hypothetical protein
MHYNELINSRNVTQMNHGGTAPEIQLRVSNIMKNEGKRKERKLDLCRIKF